MLQLAKASFFMKCYHIYDYENSMTEFLVNCCKFFCYKLPKELYIFMTFSLLRIKY